jgi:ADP-ribose pyrophosphatase YjhB (NUDIX family)
MHTIQQNILKLLNKNAKTYSNLYKTLKIKSNLFDYHLQKLLQQNLISKSKDKYKLSSIGQSISPYLEIEKQPLIAVVLAIFKDNKIVLVKREKHAFCGYWAIPGGKLNFGETIEQAAVRICEKETGLNIVSGKYLATIQELVRENQNNKHHFILLLCKIKAEGILKAGKLFSLEKLPEKIVPSDLHMLKITKAKLATSIMQEKQNNRLKQEFFN